MDTVRRQTAKLLCLTMLGCAPADLEEPQEVEPIDIGGFDHPENTKEKTEGS